MAQFIQVIKLNTRSTEIRDEFIKRITNISAYAREAEPGTTKYAVCVPRDDPSDTKTVWIIEEYSSKAAHAEHREAPIVQDLLKWASSGEALDGPPEHLVLAYVRDLHEYAFTKPSVSTLEDPYISFARIEYKPGKREDALPFWKKVFDETMGESGTYVFGLAIDEQKDHDILYTLQTYENENYLREVHLKQNKAVQGSKATLEWSVGVKHNVLRLVGGHLSR